MLLFAFAKDNLFFIIEVCGTLDLVDLPCGTVFLALLPSPGCLPCLLGYPGLLGNFWDIRLIRFMLLLSLLGAEIWWVRSGLAVHVISVIGFLSNSDIDGDAEKEVDLLWSSAFCKCLGDWNFSCTSCELKLAGTLRFACPMTSLGFNNCLGRKSSCWATLSSR